VDPLDAMDPAPTAPSAGFRSVLRNRQYVLFLGSSNASGMGYAVYAISIVWLAYSVSHDLLVVGAVLGIEYAAYTLTFLFGPIVDRVRNQRTIFLVSYPVQALAVFALGWGAVAGSLSVGLLFALVAVISLLWDMTWAAANAAPGILLTPDEQFAASGVSGTIGGGLTILGYATGGAAILLVGDAGGFFVYAALLVLAAVLAVPLRIHPPPSGGESLRTSFWDGWRLVVGGEGRPFLQLALVDAVAGFLVPAPALLVTLLAAASYSGSPAAYATLFTAEVVGGVVAGLALGRWNPRASVGTVLVGALLASGVAFAAAGALPALLFLGAGAWFAVGFATSAYADAKYVFFRAAVPPDRIGRLVSNMYLFSGAASVAGALVLGSLATGGSVASLAIGIGAVFVVAGVAAMALPGVRRMRY
jgi:hypothetical protein